MTYRRLPRGGAHPHRHDGFTLVELTIVIVIVGILVGVGAARFADPTPFRARGFAAELAQVVTAGQRYAVAQRRTVHVRLDATAGAALLCLDAACTQRIASAPGGADALLLPTGIRWLGGTSAFSFDASGAPAAGTPTSVRLADAAGTDLGTGISIEHGSGHVRGF